MILIVYLIPFTAFASSEFDSMISQLESGEKVNISIASKDGNYDSITSDEYNRILNAVKKYSVTINTSEYDSSSSLPTILNLDNYMVEISKDQAQSLISATKTDSTTLNPNDPTPETDTTQTLLDKINSENGSVFEKIIAGVIADFATSVMTALQKWTGIKSLNSLLYNDFEKPNDLLPLGSDQWNVINQWFPIMTTLSYGLAIIPLFTAIFKTMYVSINPKAKAEAKESIMRLFTFGIFTGLSLLFIHVLLYINNSIVYFFAQNVLPTKSPDSVLGMNGVLQDVKTGSALATAMIIALFVYINIRISIMFIIRKFILITFIIFTPIMSVLWAINKNINAASVWFGEIVTNIFMQSFYAFVFLVFLSIVSTGKWFECLIWALTLMPLAEALRNSLQGLMTRLSGVDEYGVAGAGMTFLGLGALPSAANTIMSQFKPSAAHQGVASAMAAMNSNSTGSNSGAGIVSGMEAGTASAANSATGTVNMSSTSSNADTNGSINVTGTSGPSGGVIGESKQIDPVAAGYMLDSLNTGSKTGHYAQRIGSFTRVAGLPGGTEGMRQVQNLVNRGSQFTTFTAGTISTIANARKYAKEQNLEGGTKEALIKMTGAKSTREAILKTASVNFSNAFSSPARVQQKLNDYGVNTSLDGMRWK